MGILRQEENPIFDLVRDTRSVKSRAWSLAAGVCIHITVLGILVVVAQVAAARSSSRRLMAELQRGMASYRMVLLAPALTPAQANTADATRPRRAKPRISAPRPLAVPDPRLLQRLDTRIQDFVRDNPGMESVITREIVRDVDSGALDAKKLLEGSHLEVSFDFDGAGGMGPPRVTASSHVPSMDHLGIETAKLLEKYRLLAAFRGCARMSISISVGDQITVKLEGAVPDPAALEEVKSTVESTLALLGFALTGSSAAFMLEDVAVEAQGTRIALVRVYDKQALIDYLMKYYQAEANK
jgi:hypothetical protein